MQAKDVITQVFEMCNRITRSYIDDLSDADLLVRSVPAANHIAWQLGHLLNSTNRMLTGLGQAAPKLPAGFAEAYTKETSKSDDPARFASHAQYTALLDQTRTAVLAAIAATPESALDKPGPEAMRDYAPTVGAVLTMLGQHWLMHAGQFVPIRRKLGKGPLF
jgi:hypothetical protein